MQHTPYAIVHEVINTYHAAVNYRDWDLFRKTFTEDAIWEIGAPVNLRFEGIESLMAGLSASVLQQSYLAQESSALVVHENEDGSIEARSTMIEWGRPASDQPLWSATIIFTDTLVRTDNGLRIAHRHGEVVNLVHTGLE